MTTPLSNQQKFAAISLNSTNDWEHNKANIKNIFIDAHSKNVNVIVLPEMFAFMGASAKETLEFAHNNHQNVLDFICGLAEQYKIWVFAGTIPWPIPNKKQCYARLWAINDSGETVGFYDKIHLFDVNVDKTVYRESETYHPGDKPTIINTPFGSVGLSVCYDIRFSNLYNYYQDHNVDILIIPAAFTTTTGQAHWHTLCKARAIESQCFLIAANQFGISAKQQSHFGHSLIINAWGKILAEDQCDNNGKSEYKAELISANYNREEQLKIRRQMPILEHKSRIIK